MKTITLLICAFCYLKPCFPQGKKSQLDIPGHSDADRDMVICKVEPEAEFPGSDQGWQKFLQKNLNPERIKKALHLTKGAPAWKQTAELSFLIERNGSLSNLKVVNQVHPLVKQEVLRVMQLSPCWKPATQGGRPVKAYRIQLITFIIESE